MATKPTRKRYTTCPWCRERLASGKACPHCGEVQPEDRVRPMGRYRFKEDLQTSGDFCYALLADTTLGDREVIARFLATVPLGGVEAEAGKNARVDVSVLAKLGHDCVEPLLDGLLPGDYLALPPKGICLLGPLREGAEPESVETARPVNLNEWLDVFVGVARALDRIHAAGGAHGNLRFENVVVDRDGSGVRVSLRCIGRPYSTNLPTIEEKSPRRAMEVTYLGTLSPRLANAETPSPSDWQRSDLFALGALMLSVLTGVPLAELFVARPTGEAFLLATDFATALRTRTPIQRDGRKLAFPNVPPELLSVVTTLLHDLYEEQHVFATHCALPRRYAYVKASSVLADIQAIQSKLLDPLILSGDSTAHGGFASIRFTNAYFANLTSPVPFTCEMPVDIRFPLSPRTANFPFTVHLKNVRVDIDPGRSESVCSYALIDLAQRQHPFHGKIDPAACTFNLLVPVAEQAGVEVPRRIEPRVTRLPANVMIVLGSDFIRRHWVLTDQERVYFP